jgi:ornithine carbamoyltransferase
VGSELDVRHFIAINDIKINDIKQILAKAAELKALRKSNRVTGDLNGLSLAMVFEKPSTRTRISFEVGMQELGGNALYLSSKDLQLGRGETVADTARVMSRYVDAIMLRANMHATLLELAEYASIPVINGLTDMQHPCQIMADLLTIQEQLGAIDGKTIAWVGDGNNMANSWMAAAGHFDITLNIACPEMFMPNQSALEKAQTMGAKINLMHNPQEAVASANVVMTDTWVSMGDSEEDKRKQALEPFQVNHGLMEQANNNAIFLHCLPAHRGEEVTRDIIDGEQSKVWDQAENRLHVQKAILLWCLQKI